MPEMSVRMFLPIIVKCRLLYLLHCDDDELHFGNPLFALHCQLSLFFHLAAAAVERRVMTQLTVTRSRDEIPSDRRGQTARLGSGGSVGGLSITL